MTIQASNNHPVRQELVDEIKLKATTWTPTEVHHNILRDVHPDEMKNRLGNLGNFEKSLVQKLINLNPFTSHARMASYKAGKNYIKSSDRFPKEFDAREKWPLC